jgi:hypothetical protein
MGVDRSRYEPKEIVMNPIRHIRRLASVLAGMACTWLGFAGAVPAASAAASPTPGPADYITPGAEPPGWHPPLQGPVHTIVIGGMPGWQITLIAIGAALLAATAAVLVYRAWTSHRKPIAAAA